MIVSFNYYCPPNDGQRDGRLLLAGLLLVSIIESEVVYSPEHAECVCAGVLDAVLAVLMPFCVGERVTGSRRLVLKEASGKAVGDTRAGCLHVLPQM